VVVNCHSLVIMSDAVTYLWARSACEPCPLQTGGEGEREKGEGRAAGAHLGLVRTLTRVVALKALAASVSSDSESHRGMATAENISWPKQRSAATTGL
jgi:hypothetical protein